MLPVPPRPLGAMSYFCFHPLSVVLITVCFLHKQISPNNLDCIGEVNYNRPAKHFSLA